MDQYVLYLINIFIASIFFVLWVEDKSRKFLLRWGVAYLMIIPLQEIALFLRYSPPENDFLANLALALSTTILTTELIFGAIDFKQITVARTTRYISRFILLASSLILLDLLPFKKAITIIGIEIGVAFFSVSYMLWSKDVIRRFFSLMFIIPGALAIFFSAGRSSPSVAAQFPVLAPLGASVSLALAIYFLQLSFRQRHKELTNNLNFMELAQSISAYVQSAQSTKGLSAEVLAIILKQKFWQGGVIFLLDEKMSNLLKIAETGTLAQIPDAVPLQGTITTRVLEKGIPLVTSTGKVFSNDHTLSPQVLEMHQKNTHDRLLIFVPLLNQGKAEGMMFLLDNQVRAILPQEIETLSSIGNVIGLAIANIRDRENLQIRATQDSLTQLGNRSSYHAFCQAIPNKKSYSVLLFDLNDFKEINDVFGHRAGDLFLISLAKRIDKQLPPNGTLFRLGGDEFVVVFVHEPNSSDIGQAVETLNRLIRKPIIIDDFSLRSSAAIGLASSTTEERDSHELLRRADMAMYEAKKQGQNIAYYNEAQDVATKERMLLLVDIEQALENNALELFYQPITALKPNDNHVKCEALLRWHHPKHGLLTAAEFMPWVESTAIIDTLTARVIDMAARDFKDIKSQGFNLTMSINLSARNMIDMRLPDLLSKTLENWGVSSDAIELEITETVLMKDWLSADVIAQQLKERGYKLIIDDFGTGHSSLTYLSRFPISSVKIDRSFIAKLTNTEEDRLVKAIIDLIHELDFSVIAEGVENAQAHHRLKEMGCDFAQGYYYSYPLPKNELLSWLHSNGVKKP
jgi:diguanylate cyclase (GGDEF)-like protein